MKKSLTDIILTTIPLFSDVPEDPFRHVRVPCLRFPPCGALPVSTHLDPGVPGKINNKNGFFTTLLPRKSSFQQLCVLQDECNPPEVTTFELAKKERIVLLNVASLAQIVVWWILVQVSWSQSHFPGHTGHDFIFRR